MILWGLKSCDSCRTALNALAAAGVGVEVRDLRADGLPADLDAWLADLGVDALVNRRSTTWRGLDDADRARADTAAGAAALLRAHPTLARRPLIESGTIRSAGWGPAQQALHV